MIPTYYIEDLSLEDLDNLIEKGECFDVTSKVAVLPTRDSDVQRDSVRSDRSKSF